MARIDALPAIDIIRGFKGILDFYLWRGLPCVRAWPAYRPARQTDASKASALLFGAIIKAFSLTAGPVLDQLAIEATGIPRTTRDIYVSGVYGNLHEASMSDFLDLLTECRDFLSALTAILNALDSIDTDELVVNVDESVLPPLAATTTNQATMITALQKLDDLQDALQSKALDRFLVRGMDQLFSFKEQYHYRWTYPGGAAGDVADTTPAVPANTVRIITNIFFVDTVGLPAWLHARKRRAGIDYHITSKVPTVPSDALVHSCWIPLEPDDVIILYATAVPLNDPLRASLLGFDMTLET